MIFCVRTEWEEKQRKLIKKTTDETKKAMNKEISKMGLTVESFLSPNI